MTVTARSARERRARVERDERSAEQATCHVSARLNRAGLISVGRSRAVSRRDADSVRLSFRQPTPTLAR